jgi:hypothetical protein
MRRTFFVLTLILASGIAGAQEQKPFNWSVGGGLGLFHYINTLDVGADLAQTNHVGYTFRFMWEPEHRVSIGLESGYYTVYSMERPPSSAGPGGNAKLSTIPLLLSFRIRVLPDFYLSGGPGMTIMYSNVTVLGNTAESSFLSMANLHVSAMYRKKISDRFDLGGELKFLNFGKTEDYGYSIQVVGAYRFRFKD